MTNERRVIIHPDKETVASSAAARFLTKTVDLLDVQDEAHIVLTGGSLGIGVLAEVAGSRAKNTVDWTRVHFWWGDERFLPADHPDRNALQAREALLDGLTLDPAKVHPFPASDEIPDLDEAAEAYAAELGEHAFEGLDLPRFDITFLGVGPDGHIASLFPGKEEINVTDRLVVPVRNSPKPPPERLSLTLPAINSSDRIWLVLSGADKAPALGLALAGASQGEVPVAAPLGRKRTVFFVDQEAAAQVPSHLIASSY